MAGGWPWTSDAANWDHDTGDIEVCTRSRAMKTKLRKLGLKPIRDGVADYATFRAHEDRLRLSLRKPKNMSLAAKKAVASRLTRARKRTQ
jgi:hypothetical protein